MNSNGGWVNLSLTLLSAAVVTGCAESDPPHAAERPRVLWICVDTLRADHLSCYGYERPTSPRLDALAARGARFTQTHSPSSWTKPSIPSLFTGAYPADHQVYEGSSKDHAGRIVSDLLAESWTTVAEVFQEAGYATGGFIHNSHLRGFLGFAQGFDVYRDDGKPAEELNAECLEWLDTLEGEPWFAYVHYLDVHWPYRPDESHAARFPAPAPALDLSGEDAGALRDRVNDGLVTPTEADLEAMVARYDACIHHNDAAIGALLDALDARGLLDHTLIVVTSDHGEEFLEHGKLGHGQSLRDSLTHVPWIIAGPGVQEGLALGGMTELIDVLPTTLALSGLDAPRGCVGLDQSPVLLGQTSKVAPREASFGELLHGRRYERSVRTDTFKLIESFRALRTPEVEPISGAPLLRPGLRIEVEGEFDGGDFVAEEFSLEDSPDEDCEVRGPVEDLSLADRTFRIGPLQIRIDKDAELHSRTLQRPMTLSEFSEGDVVDVDGAMESGVLVADELERREDKRPGDIQIEALIEDVDAEDREITLLGFEVEFEDDVDIPGFSRIAARSTRPRPPGHELTLPELYERSVTLFDLRSDPEERIDRLDDRPEVADRLSIVLRTWFEERAPHAPSEQQALDDEMLEALRQIGYIR